MNKSKSTQIINMLAEGLSAIEISEKLRVSTRDIYLVKKDLPLFGGLIRDIEENIVNLRKKNCRKIK